MEGIKAAFSPGTQQLLTRYFMADDERLFAAAKNSVMEMRDSGVAKPIIFSQLMMTLQVLAVTQGVNLPAKFPKVRAVVNMIYPDEDYALTIAQQLMSVLVKSKNHVREAVRPDAPVGDGVTMDDLREALGRTGVNVETVVPAGTQGTAGEFVMNPFGTSIPRSFN